MKRGAHADFTLFLVSMLLLCGGLVMIYSASAIWADQNLRGDTFYFVKRQLVWAAIGFCAMAFFSRLNYNRLKEWTWPIMVLTAMALTAALFGPPIKGVRRWIHLGPVGLQPSEFAKLACASSWPITWTANTAVWTPRCGAFSSVGVISFFLLLIGLGPDLGPRSSSSRSPCS